VKLFPKLRFHSQILVVLLFSTMAVNNINGSSIEAIVLLAT
jgi:hypothetical protein